MTVSAASEDTVPAAGPATTFEALPGIETPVDGVRGALAEMWDGEGTGDRPAPSEFRASQMNLVIHFGLDATPGTARAGFETALAFSRRYPCRILALCPRAGTGGGVVAKVFGECFIGSSRHDMVCTEAIVLAYPLDQRAHLQDQASIMVESDLPLFYWPQHIQVAARLRDYPLFLREAKRIVVDSAIEHPETVAFDWPRPELLRDLAFARTLPVRQGIGHFLSYVAPARLVEGLREVRVAHAAPLCAEAAKTLAWMRESLEGCARSAGRGLPADATFSLQPAAKGGDGALVVTCHYADGGHVGCHFDLGSGTSCLECRCGGEERNVSSAVRLLAPEAALAEALFF